VWKLVTTKALTSDVVVKTSLVPRIDGGLPAHTLLQPLNFKMP